MREKNRVANPRALKYENGGRRELNNMYKFRLL